MTDRPILFSAPMIRALLEGRKTMTRRLLTASNSSFGSAPREFWDHADFTKAWPDGAVDSGMYLHVPCHCQEDEHQKIIGVDCRRCDEMGWSTTSHRLWPTVRGGDRLWVRETWRGAACTDHLPPREIQGACCWYEADSNAPEWAGKLRPSIFLPQKLSRLTLIVTGAKVERVQDISEADAIAEGCAGTLGPNSDFPDEWDPSPCEEFAELWGRINGAGSWNENPWVVAISFRVIQANIDRIEPAP